jgi:hypothetical protein
MENAYPVRFSVDYPDRPLNRLSTGFRIFTVIPIAIVLATIGEDWGQGWGGGGWDGGWPMFAGGAGLLALPPLLMILFRKKYPRWWFDWNLELQRFGNRVGVYFLLMDDRYPSTDEHQSVHFEMDYPNVEEELGRGMPLVKWFLAIPHYVILLVLYIGVFFAAIVAWFAIVFSARYPRGIFNFIEGTIRWHNRVLGYMFLMVTDRYPPFRLEA